MASELVNLTWQQAREIARDGTRVRPMGITDRWYFRTPGLLWIESMDDSFEPRVAQASDFTGNHYSRTDWTTRWPDQESCASESRPTRPPPIPAGLTAANIGSVFLPPIDSIFIDDNLAVRNEANRAAACVVFLLGNPVTFTLDGAVESELYRAVRIDRLPAFGRLWLLKTPPEWPVVPSEGTTAYDLRPSLANGELELLQEGAVLNPAPDFASRVAYEPLSLPFGARLDSCDTRTIWPAKGLISTETYTISLSRELPTVELWPTMTTLADAAGSVVRRFQFRRRVNPADLSRTGWINIANPFSEACTARFEGIAHARLLVNARLVYPDEDQEFDFSITLLPSQVVTVSVDPRGIYTDYDFTVTFQP